MGNWSNYKIILYFASIVTYILLSASTNKNTLPKWGFQAHKKINRLAIFTLKGELFRFYKENIEFITEHAVDPDKRRYIIENEAPCHFIDIDYFNHIDSIPKQWDKAILKYGKDTLEKHGIVPWHILHTKYKLQKAFEEKDFEAILRYSSDIGHYIGDAHVPLHTTKNYNGQLTNQHGIHGLWESRLIELFGDKYNYFTGNSIYIENPTTFIWKAINSSFNAVDTVLNKEKEISEKIKNKYTYEQKGNLTVKTYSKEFSEEYHKSLNRMVERRLRASIIAVGSIWYTAWVDAGQPSLSNLKNKEINEYLKQISLLEKEHKNKTQLGRICEH